MPDMKQLLLRLGENLVREHGFQPGMSGKGPKTIEPLMQFLLWLDKTPEARDELTILGYDFHRTSALVPVSRRQPPVPVAPKEDELLRRTG